MWQPWKGSEDDRLRVLGGALFAAVILGLLILAYEPTANVHSLVGCLSDVELPTKLPRSAVPSNARRCGNWQQKYTLLHKRILSGELPPRYVVSVAVEAGLADRLTGIITEFYFALLTGRAFQITPGNQPAFEEAFSSPNINWTRPNDPDSLVRPLNNRVHDAEGSSWAPETDHKRYGFWYLTNTDLTEFFKEADVRTLHWDKETVFISNNHGATYMLFSNPFHRDELLDMGLRPETAFACAYDYLFSPRVERFSPEMKREIKALEREQNAIKIGIMVRAGDKVFEGDDSTPLSRADGFLKCAADIELSRANGPEDRVIWYFMSESLSLRKKVKEKYGDKVITNVEQAAIHPDCEGRHGQSEGCKNRSLSGVDKAVEGLLFGVAQLHAFSRTDYQVFKYSSGFGRVGAWLSASRHWHPLSLYSMEEERGTCTPSQAESLEYSAGQWSGI